MRLKLRHGQSGEAIKAPLNWGFVRNEIISCRDKILYLCTLGKSHFSVESAPLNPKPVSFDQCLRLTLALWSRRGGEELCRSQNGSLPLLEAN